jgi:hypothetical protein
MGASISSSLTVGIAAMVLATNLLLWGVSRAVCSSEQPGLPVSDQNGTNGRQVYAPARVPVAVRTYNNTRRPESE